jgi:hypothetical protein
MVKWIQIGTVIRVLKDDTGLPKSEVGERYVCIGVENWMFRALEPSQEHGFLILYTGEHGFLGGSLEVVSWD